MLPSHKFIRQNNSAQLSAEHRGIIKLLNYGQKVEGLLNFFFGILSFLPKQKLLFRKTNCSTSFSLEHQQLEIWPTWSANLRILVDNGRLTNFLFDKTQLMKVNFSEKNKIKNIRSNHNSNIRYVNAAGKSNDFQSYRWQRNYRKKPKIIFFWLQNISQKFYVNPTYPATLDYSPH